MTSTYTISVPNGKLKEYFDSLAEQHILSKTIGVAMTDYQARMQQHYEGKKDDILTLDGLIMEPSLTVLNMPTLTVMSLINTIDDVKTYLNIWKLKHQEAHSFNESELRIVRRSLINKLALKLSVTDEQSQSWLIESDSWEI